jgi:AcrR family transcriptional regulator
VQARARRTREKIIARAKRAFAERGFEATNLTEHILTPAGVSVGSFYHQFSNKREVLLEIFDHTIAERHARIKERIAAASASSFGESFRDVLETLCDDVDANHDVWLIQWREYESPDAEIRTRALIGIEGWTYIARSLIDPWYPADHPQSEVAARQVALIGFMVVREYTHVPRNGVPDDLTATREALLAPAIVFATAGLDRMLAA